MTQEFEQGIRQWIKLDNQLKEINAKAKQIREERSQVTDALIEQSETHGLQNATINITNGKLKIAETKTPAQLSIKFIQQCLYECIDDQEQVNYLVDYIKEKRPYKIGKDVKRYFNKE